MKKYLMTGIAALAMGGMFTSCSHDMSLYSGSQSEQVLQKYEDTFVETFGEPAPTQTWGFGSTSAATRGMTRAAQPATPSFRKKSDVPTIETPTFATTLTAATNEGAVYAGSVDQNSWTDGMKVYIDENYGKVDANKSSLTIYVNGDVKYYGGVSANGSGYTFVVLENSTLRMGVSNENMKVYLAPGAKLITTKKYSENVINWYPYESEIAESDNNDALAFNKSNALLYLSAGSEVTTGTLHINNGGKVLNDGGEIKANNITVENTNSTLWNNGTLTVSDEVMTHNEKSFIYNAEGKTIKARTLAVTNNNNLVVNEGTLQITDSISLRNQSAELINLGTMTATDYSQAAGGKTYNSGTATFTGKTKLTNSNSSWVNAEQWTTGSIDVDNYSHTNFNNCRLNVNGNFHLNRGTFSMAANAGVVCESFTWEDTSDFYLGSNAVLKINGDLLTKNANSNYGFRATGDDYAVVQAARIYHEGNEQFRMSYYGKLLVATQNHFDQWYKDAPNTQQPAYWYESSVKFTKDGQNIATIPETDCNPGFIGAGGGGGGVQAVTDSIRVIGEDLTVNQRSDFDFNDVVFDVYWTHTPGSPDNQTVKIIVRAAGGELPIYIGNGDNALEIHELFGAENPTRNVTVKTMMNTTNGNHYYENPDGSINSNAYKCPVVLLEDDWWSGDNIQDIANSIQIRVYKPSTGTQFELKAPKGDVPSKIAVGTDYEWCDERQDIDKKYPTDNVEFDGRFSEYVAGQHDWNTWYLQKK